MPATTPPTPSSGGRSTRSQIRFPLIPRLGNVKELLRGDFPNADLDILKLGTRRAGLGSLGRPRVVVVAQWYGSLVCREAKAVLPSAWDWAEGAGDAKPQ